MDLAAEEGARVVALGLLDEADRAADELAEGARDEPLHDFRVAVRRLRSALKTFRPWLEDGVARRHERRLKKITRATNAPRDAEVQLAWLASKRDALASARQRVGYDLLASRYEARAHEGPDTAQLADRFRRAAKKLRRRLETYERRVQPGGDGGASFGAVLAALVDDQTDEVSARLAAIGDATDELGVHKARIEAKRLRYLIEPLRGYRRADSDGAVRHLKSLQDALGELHDAHVLAGELRQALMDAGAERAAQLHAAVYAYGASDAAIRDRLRASPRPGLLALVRLVRERRDALYASLESEWRAHGLGALVAEIREVAGALEARAGGKLEHERKFLLASLPPKAEEDAGVEITQGWVPGAQLRERIRRVRGPDGERYWRGLKRGTGKARLEAEEETTRGVFETLWPLTEGYRIAKRRRRVHEGSLVWEIDEFLDRELILAEVELPARMTELDLPDWLQPLVVREVTDDPGYLNENLAAAALREQEQHPETVPLPFAGETGGAQPPEPPAPAP